LGFEVWGCRLFAERSEQMSDSDGALVAPELAIFSVFAAATLVGRLGSCGEQ